MKSRSAIALTVALLFLWALFNLAWCEFSNGNEGASTQANQKQHARDLAFLNLLFGEIPRSIDLTKLNDGDWLVACAGGNLPERATMKRAAQTVGVVVTDAELDLVPVLKSGGLFFYIAKDRKARWFQYSQISGQIAFGEVVCASPAHPFLKLPTDAALKDMRARGEQSGR